MIRQMMLLLTAAAVSIVAAAADGTQILESQCAGCHALTKPEKTDVNHIWERKGPDLYYAGNKFQPEWLEQWLQKPQRIRPGGELYRKHLKSSADGDVIDTASLSEHPALNAEDAKSVAKALMALTVPDLIETGAFKGAEVSPTMGSMFFVKLRGCGACHEDAPNKGGVSGPELYTAHKRLQADYVYSFIKTPQKIDPHVWMPELGLGDADLQRLTGFIMQMKGGDAQ